MKKIILLLIVFCFLFIINYASAQKYYPLVDTNKIWGINMEVQVTTHPLFIWCIKFTQDTTINKVIYKKVMQSYDSLNNSWKNIGYIRETTDEKVYLLYNKTDTVERLLYNFNMKKGDSICISNIYTSQCHTFFVDSIDSIYIGKQIRKRMILNYHEVWIEGIGSLCGILYSGLSEISGDKYILSCFKENDTLKYVDTNYLEGWEDPVICFLNPVSTINYKNAAYTIEVFPNPANSFIVVSCSLIENINVKIEIYDVMGKEVKELEINKEKKISIDISDLRSGVYVVKVGSEFVKFIKL